MSMTRVPISDFGKAAAEAAIAVAYLRPEMTVADIGVGAGFMTAALAPLVRQVVAVDGSAGLPFEDGSLDAIFAEMARDPQAAIVEMARVLRPGGRLTVVAAAGLRNPAPLGCGTEQVKAWLRAAGLVNVLVKRVPPQTGDAAAAEISVLVATGSRRVGGAREAVQANYGALAEGAGSCCSPSGAAAAAAEGSCCAPSSAMALVEAGHPEVVLYDTGYTAEQLAAVPAEAAGLSLGCGNPTAFASLRPGEVVLDIGSGAGIDAFYAAKRVGPQGRVIGLDMTPAMIERARRSAQAAGLSQVEFRLGQAEAMPVEDGMVDVILSNCVINLAEDKGKVFEEAYRVLKAGGRLSISDMVTEGPLPMNLRGDAQMWAGCINGALPQQEYLDLVKQAGFTDVTAQRTLSGGELAGVPVYSLSVSARKGRD